MTGLQNRFWFSVKPSLTRRSHALLDASPASGEEIGHYRPALSSSAAWQRLSGGASRAERASGAAPAMRENGS